MLRAMYKPLSNHPSAPPQRRSANSSRPQQAKNWPGLDGSTFTWIAEPWLLMRDPPRSMPGHQLLEPATPDRLSPTVRTYVEAERTAAALRGLPCPTLFGGVAGRTSRLAGSVA